MRADIDKLELELGKWQLLAPEKQDQIKILMLAEKLDWLRKEVGYVAPDKSIIRDPRNSDHFETGVTSINIDQFDEAKRKVAQKIIGAFAAAGLGTVQQIAALSSAIVNSDLSPSAKSAFGEVGLFQISLKGLGSGYTEEQLMDPEVNIDIILEAAKKYQAFTSATSLDQSVLAFEGYVERPLQIQAVLPRLLTIAKGLSTKY